MDIKNLVSILNKETGCLETYDVISGALIYEGNKMVARSRHLYSLERSLEIAQLVREGYTIKAIAEMEGMPSVHVLSVWKKVHPDFAEMLAIAKADRAEHYRDKAIDILESPLDEEDLRIAKFKFDGYTKIAAQDNPTEFGQKREEGGSAPTQIIINTGVPLGEQQVYQVTADGLLV